ncbi:hypothetical protein CNMCM7927_006736 [Aspergillus lentulus]|nr:hypothetical protein CNMCM7927_006736 [Aspergillus lentulus]
MAYVEKQYRKAGIVVPFIDNDAIPIGNWAAGDGLGAVDMYSFDDYPLAWATAPDDPSDWSRLTNPLSVYNFSTHMGTSPHTPMSISEFQGGVPDAWGGVGMMKAAAYIGADFERVFYKLNYGFRATIHSLYMVFGGTNWGHLGHPGGYTSYDNGAAIAENRQVDREKYSELKLQANFLRASPQYLVSLPDNGTFGVYASAHDLVTTKLTSNHTIFFLVRHADLSSTGLTAYRLRVPTSMGILTIPQLGGSLTLNGRDSKFHVVDYEVGNIKLIYSTAEIFTWKKSHDRTVLVLYGGAEELHEFAVHESLGSPCGVEGKTLEVKKMGHAAVVKWRVEPSRQMIAFGNELEVHMLSRNEAYSYWVMDLPSDEVCGRYVSSSGAQQSVIINAGYLLRTAEVSGNKLFVTGDINATTGIEIISTPTPISSVFFNGQLVETVKNGALLTGVFHYQHPNLSLPTIKSLSWRYINNLPEIQEAYDDSKWTTCNLSRTHNPRNLTTPTSLYASDYGYHAGSLLYRGTFVANGSESSMYLLTEGGYAYGHSVWLNSTYLGSWEGSAGDIFYNHTLKFPTAPRAGATYVLTVLIDHMGLDENFVANVQTMKDPRGILDYQVHGREKSSISWKMTGNLGGERYQDHSRGPLNEGGFYAERQGFHLPGAPTVKWERLSPLDAFPGPGVGFYVTTFDLDIPLGYDVPISVVFTNTTIANVSKPAKFRSEIFINGWQFGKYINHIGPQCRYPIPEGILNYNGPNTLAITVWSQEENTAGIHGLELSIDACLQSRYEKPALVQGASYSPRNGGY